MELEPAAPEGYDPALVARHDGALEALLARQVTAPQHPCSGGIPDSTGIFFAGSCGGLLESGIAALLCPQSRFHASTDLAARLRLASARLEKMQNGAGNIDLPTTNFNSPPDTAFVVHGVANAAVLAQRAANQELLALTLPFLRRAAGALAVGGVHTPNHRWVICQALAQINELMPDERWLKRIDQWLAEGIDIDDDAQYTERSTVIYDAVVNRALTTLALKLDRPHLLAPVRRNLDAMLYLLHPDGGVVTEVSRRQDRNTAGDLGGHWFPLRYLALRDRNGRYATLARRYDERHASLPLLMVYPQLRATLPPDEPLPEDYARPFPALGAYRVRRGKLSVTAFANGDSRFLSLRSSACVVEGVRFASAFFGQGQFRPNTASPPPSGPLLFEQSIEAGYWQPFDPPRRVGASDWDSTRSQRSRSEVMKMRYEVRMEERPAQWRVEIGAAGTDNVPLAVEITLRPGGQLEGCEAASGVEGAMLLREGFATYRVGGDAIRFGPGAGEHSYTQIRGAEPRLPGLSVYLCGFTPFRRTVTFDFL